MAVINFAHREITAKIVYFGATGAGCNTNVRALYTLLEEAEHKSRLHKFGPPDTRERSWYFELRRPSVQVRGFSVRFRIYSMPGALEQEQHRDEVMKGVDGIVMVADSRKEAAAENDAALLELEEVLSAQGLDLAGLPVVIQVNHSDRESAREESAVVFDLNPYGFPVLTAAAKSHTGVVETFAQIADTAVQRLQMALDGEDGAIALRALHRAEEETDADVIREHLASIQGPVGPAAFLEPDNTATPPGDEVEVPFQPREFAGSYPVRVMDATLENGQVYVDLELERMGGGELRQLRVRLANRPTDSPAMPRPVVVTNTSNTGSPVLDALKHLPDKVDLHHEPRGPEMPPVFYGVLGISGGIVTGLLLGFLLFN